MHKSVVETGKVSITKQVHEREVMVDEPLVREGVEITRVPVQLRRASPSRSHCAGKKCVLSGALIPKGSET